MPRAAAIVAYSRTETRRNSQKRSKSIRDEITMWSFATLAEFAKYVSNSYQCA
jgi:hypothetical protein